MTTLMRYDPFREALRLRDAMEQLFAQSFVRLAGAQGRQTRGRDGLQHGAARRAGGGCRPR